MMRSGLRSAVALLLLGAVLAGCRWDTDGPGARLPVAQVGSLVHRWAESDSAEAPGVRAVRRHHLEPQLITDEQQWSRFVRGLPASLRTTEARQDLDRVDLRHSVVVVAAYGKCTEVSHLEDRGDARLAFVVTSDPKTNCAWSPTQLEIWQVGLDELGVDDGGSVRLTS